jgi:hypothetical protein
MVTIQPTRFNQLGAYAKQQYEIGDIVIRESPVAVTNDYIGNVMWSLTYNIINRCSNNMEQPDLINKILSLNNIKVANSPELDKITIAMVSKKYKISKNKVVSLYNIVCRNAYWISNYLTLHKHGFALYLLISRINHSCNPNCAFVFDKIDGMIVATRDIKPGEEITVGYHFMTSSLIPKTIRVDLVSRFYNFDCCCQECSSNNSEILTWNNEETTLFTVLSKSVIGSSFLKLGLIILETRQNILGANPILFLILSAIYIRSFFHEGNDETSMITVCHLAQNCVKLLPEIRESYLKFYVELLCNIVLEIPMKNEKLPNLLLCNDREDCPVF